MNGRGATPAQLHRRDHLQVIGPQGGEIVLSAQIQHQAGACGSCNDVSLPIVVTATNSASRFQSPEGFSASKRMAIKFAIMTSIKASFDLAGLFDFLEDVLAWVKDRYGRYLWVNRAFLIHYALEHPNVEAEYCERRVLGKTDYDLSPPFLADQFRLDDEHVLAGNRIVNRIERVGEFQGIAGWNVTNKIPVFDSKGKIVGTAGITRTLNRPPQHPGAAAGFGLALEHIRNHYQRPITNRQLAGVSKMSLRAFERQFLASFHLTPQKYLRKLRLRIASRALIYTNESLSELALNCGFADQSHFTREFRRQFGRTPRDYREHYQAAAAASGIKSAVPKQ